MSALRIQSASRCEKLLRFETFRTATGIRIVVVAASMLVLAPIYSSAAQQTDGASTQAPAASAESATTPQASTPQTATADAEGNEAQAGGFSEEALKQMLVGKTFYLRGGYLDDSLAFSENGRLIGHSPQGSYTLSMVQIDRVHLTRHKVELEGVRYGLHFLGALPYEDPATAADKVRITPKKKTLKISIDRELVIKPKKTKEVKETRGGLQAAQAAPSAPAPAGDTAEAAPATNTQSAQAPDTAGDEAEARAAMAAEPAAERPSDPGSITTTFSQSHANQVLKNALGNILAAGLDDRLKASMPAFWKLYYQAAASKGDYRPSDPSVMRQSAVDKKARLVSTFEPQSNQYAQDNGVAGMALYHAVIGVDGKPEEIAVARPIGFGLDENAVEAIRNARFEPAMKDGKPVSVLLDLAVQFRIYSKRTSEAAPREATDKPDTPSLPGPYSVHPPQ